MSKKVLVAYGSRYGSTEEMRGQDRRAAHATNHYCIRQWKSHGKKEHCGIRGPFIAIDYLTVENAADIIVLPYYQSTQSGALAHAFSLGKPVIITDVGGLMAEVHESGAGVIVARYDLDQLDAYIALLLLHKDMREEYARHALA